MKQSNHLIAIYDFGLFPYALGDVLTWNIRTAMRCEELGKEFVDVFICLDEYDHANVHQRDLVTADNYDLFFTELYSAFGTNPRLGNLHFFRNREAMLACLQGMVHNDTENTERYDHYLNILKQNNKSKNFRDKIIEYLESSRFKPLIKKLIKQFFSKKIKEAVSGAVSTKYALSNYFINEVRSHEVINQFYKKNNYIPRLNLALGCVPDVDEFIDRKLQGKIIVPFHLRLRRLDLGYGGDNSYTRDSNFLEWYNFIREASIKYPQVQFIALGRLQEKPLELLRLPNVTSLRILGMGLGHELTLMLKSHFFMGSSSGFAAYANFTPLPYFVTRMNEAACEAYDIPYPAEHLPFAHENQKLIYEEETTELLMRLLVEGLSNLNINLGTSVKTEEPSSELDVAAWIRDNSKRRHTASTTCRFYQDEKYRLEETLYLLLPYLENAHQAYAEQDFEKAQYLVKMLKTNFPELCKRIPQFLILEAELADTARLNRLTPAAPLN